MSKYDPLWAYVQAQDTDRLQLTFDEIEAIAGAPIDHSFLTYKKELAAYGWQVGRISQKLRTVAFTRLP